MKGSPPIADLGIVIAAGGSGSRFAPEKSKLFAEYDKMPIFIHSVKNFIDLCPPEHFILVIKEEHRADFASKIKKFLPGRQVHLVSGGETRMHSVFNGLQALPESAKFAAIHDAARPFATAELLLDCLGKAREHRGAIVAKRITDTVKKGCPRNFVSTTLNRQELWTVETPQIFPRKELLDAYRRAFADGLEATDDAGVMEHAGLRSFLFEHKSDNRKITYPENMILDF